jgi:lactate 2-monooxygenase
MAQATLFMGIYSNPTITWDRVSFLRGVTKLPIFLKGINHPADARQAIRIGMDGIIVSNHGGRQVDGAIAALDALELVAREVGGAIPVLFDSGIRSGADVFKALALGADAVLIGRPYVYGLALDGEAGVAAVLRNMLAELDLTMGLSGCRTIGEVKEAVLF